tara:strand:+ start:410 stop:682 length:273 start_codon:yes stop_codon:yes gene_type:complete
MIETEEIVYRPWPKDATPEDYMRALKRLEANLRDAEGDTEYTAEQIVLCGFNNIRSALRYFVCCMTEVRLLNARMNEMLGDKEKERGEEQ